MMLNSCQRIVKDGVTIQAGDIDTVTKFGQLTQGVELRGKRVLDIGCNLGMMCSLASQQGADAMGIDINRDYIDQARGLFPGIPFTCLPAEDIYGSYDIIIASSLLHYIKDLDKVLNLFARCAKLVLCDVWLHGSPDAVFALSHREIYVPSRSAFHDIAGKYFKSIEEKGEALSPDGSKRYVFHLSQPTPVPAEAVIIYGEGDTGKSTLARTYFGYTHLMTDNLFGTWKAVNVSTVLSVSFYANLARGNYHQQYDDFFINTLKAWLVHL